MKANWLVEAPLVKRGGDTLVVPVIFLTDDEDILGPDGDTVGDVAVKDGVEATLDKAEVVVATLDAGGGMGTVKVAVDEGGGGMGTVKVAVGDGGAGWLTVSVAVRVETLTPPGPIHSLPFGQQPYCPLSPRLQYSVGGHPREASGQHV